MASIYVIQTQLDGAKHSSASESPMFYNTPGEYVKSATLGFNAATSEAILPTQQDLIFGIVYAISMIDILNPGMCVFEVY